MFLQVDPHSVCNLGNNKISKAGQVKGLKIDQIPVVPEICYPVLTIAVTEDEGVITDTPIQHVGPGAALQHVISGTALQHVSAGAAPEHITALTAVQGIIAPTAEQPVIARAAVYGVTVRITTARSTVDRIVAPTA